MRSRLSGRTVVVTRVPQADQAAVGPVEAIRLPIVGKLTNGVENGPDEQWLDALVHLENHPTARDRTVRRPHIRSRAGPYAPS